MDPTLVTVLISYLAAIAKSERFNCPTAVDYVSQPISVSQSKDFLFYGVQQDINSISDCAKFCYETEFCRSAAYSSKARTCQLAYANVMKCQDSVLAGHGRPSGNSDQLIAIYCIRCPQGKTEEAKRTVGLPSSTGVSINALDSFDSGIGHQSGGKFNQPVTQTEGTCFVEYEQMLLLGASYSTEKNLTLDQCKCRCASTWTTFSLPPTTPCRSFQYYPDRTECVLNSLSKSSTNQTSTNTSFVDMSSHPGSYYDFTCLGGSTVTNLVSEYCKKHLPVSEPTPTASPTGPASTEKISRPANDTGACFEYVHDHLLTGLAGGLEHDISLEQCQCLCANSGPASGKYDFRCKSIMYYPYERDCVLNLDNRTNRPDLFRKGTEEDMGGGKNYSITYAGLICQDDFLTKYINEQCAQTQTSTVQTTVLSGPTAVSLIDATVKIVPDQFPLGPLPPPGERTDECFVEINEYVLGGMASAIEGDVTVDGCKCLCTDSVIRYGFICLSIQYYPDVKTCLLNRKNRIQEPNSFKKVVSTMPHTYLDYLCGDQGSKRELYRTKNCLNQQLPDTASRITKSDPSILSSLTSPTTVAATLSSTTPTPQLTTFPQPQLNSIFASETRLGRPLDRGLSAPLPAPPLSSSPTPSPVRPSSDPRGPCRYSAFYETEFTGRRMIERIVVGDPLMCFKNCAQKKCKSANILNFLGRYKYCELFSDSSTDYLNTNLIRYNAASVYFDGIVCDRV